MKLLSVFTALFISTQTFALELNESQTQSAFCSTLATFSEPVTTKRCTSRIFGDCVRYTNVTNNYNISPRSCSLTSISDARVRIDYSYTVYMAEEQLGGTLECQFPADNMTTWNCLFEHYNHTGQLLSQQIKNTADTIINDLL